ncbi:hypothetical protein [Desulfurococcus amylolyticus]|uniref:hypothetical protein n=1 Tax=Desulfurococcus amylolyticus TaxID=94694 RepID=UPI0012FEC084|nr:hypothetical protein [Desulfurococcus amylolyticus]
MGYLDFTLFGLAKTGAYNVFCNIGDFSVNIATCSLGLVIACDLNLVVYWSLLASNRV